MKTILTILLTCILAISLFGQGIVVLRYYLNKAYIVSSLCQNRTRPTLNCDGKCVLAKKLMAQEKQQKDTGIHFSERFEVLSSKIFFSVLPAPIITIIASEKRLRSDKRLAAGFSSIFHPPDRC